MLPDNAQLETVVQFAPDPRGWSFFASLLSRARRDLNNGSRIYIDARSERWSGWTATPQRFTRLHAISGGQARAVASTTSQLIHERSTANEGAMRAFYERLSMGQS